MTLTVEFRRDEGVRFHQPIAHSDALGGIGISQTIGGDQILVRYGGQAYRVSVEQLAVALVEAVRESGG